MSKPMTSRLDFHKGQTLLAIAGTYTTILQVVCEWVQNALDTGATFISLTVDQKRRRLVCRDNGEGVDKPRFDDALTSICQTKKKPGKLGKYGRGLISILGKCREFSFTSTPAHNRAKYFRWEFSPEDLRSEKTDLEIPVMPLGDHYYCPEGEHAPPGKKGVPWRTECRAEGYTEDRVLSTLSLEEIRSAILDKFSLVMRRQKTVASLVFIDEGGAEHADEFTGKEFEGMPLPEFAVEDPDAGRVTFTLYLALRTVKGRVGKVVMGEAEDDYRFAFEDFAASMRDHLDSEMVDAFSSGTFEGEITAAKAKLHPNRKTFERNDAAAGVCLALGTWYEKVGQDHCTSAEEKSRFERYQELARESLRNVEGLLDQPDYQDLMGVVKGFKVGTVGTGHKRPPRKAIVGVQETGAVAVQGWSTGGSSGGGGSEEERTEPKDEHPEHTPFTVLGPKGHRRTLVKGSSTGLQFAHEEMPSSEQLWDLDTTHGILTFNIRHPLWGKAEANDHAVVHLQNMVALGALMLQTYPEDQQEFLRSVADRRIRPEIELLIRSDILRRPSAKTHGGAKTKAAKAAGPKRKRRAS